MREKRGVYSVLEGKPEGRRPLERPRCRWEDNIKMYLQKVGWGSLDWIDLVQDRDKWRALVNAVIYKTLQIRGIQAQCLLILRFSVRCMNCN
jgi:hypothetical protein